MSLVLFIGARECDIPGLLAYVDDTFAVDPRPERLYYPPYQESYPNSQVQLLQLWDWLGIPHQAAVWALFDHYRSTCGFRRYDGDTPG